MVGHFGVGHEDWILEIHYAEFNYFSQKDGVCNGITYTFNFKKITSVGSSAFQKNLQWLDQQTLVIFLEMKKKLFQKKLQLWDQSTTEIQHL